MEKKPILTQRQSDLLDDVAAGRSAEEIAKARGDGVQPSKIEEEEALLRQTMKANSNEGMLAKARRWGWL